VIVAARKDIADNPHAAAAWAQLGRTLLVNELQPDIILVCFLEAERLDTDNPRGPYFAGGVLLNLGRQEDSLPTLERAVALCDRTHKYLGRRQEALVAFREAVHCSPEFADTHLNLGQALAEEGNLTDARYYLDQAVLLAGPNDRRPRDTLHKYFPADRPKTKT
jgi:tetratricopeptide (TPR) repeat protein